MSITLVVAASDDGVIGRDGQLPWRLSTDLRRFKQLTMGHHILMGRKTYESIGRLLPGRTSVIITRQQGYEVLGALIAHSFDEARAYSEHDEQAFVIGGGEVYRLALPVADRIMLTRVHGRLEGDTYFEFASSAWRVVEQSEHVADERNSHDHTFQILERAS